MTLLEAVTQVVEKSNTAAQLTDLAIGTVTSASPLKITIDATQTPLEASVLLLTETVVEKRTTALKHKHTDEEPDKLENIVLQRGLAVNDKVLLLRVQHGQRYVVLSRVVGG